MRKVDRVAFIQAVGRPLLPLCLLTVVFLAGCNMVWRRILPDPEKNQVIRVEKGERLYFDLEENGTTGYQWYCTCTDPDVEVTIDHYAADAKDGLAGAPGRAEVRIRIHRGYDGPSDVTFRYKRSWEKAPIKKFTLSLFRRTGDCAFWE